MCPRCGEVLAGRPALSEAEKDGIREKSILRGKVAELESRQKSYKSKISQLRTYIVLLIIALIFNQLLCNRKKQPSISAFANHIEARFAEEQVGFQKLAIQELMNEAPTFLYITTYGDNPESLSKAFYQDGSYADIILKDNYIHNDRRIPTGDTLILRKNPRQVISNVLEIKAIQKHELIKGSKDVLRDFPKEQ